MFFISETCFGCEKHYVDNCLFSLIEQCFSHLKHPFNVEMTDVFEIRRRKEEKKEEEEEKRGVLPKISKVCF